LSHSDADNTKVIPEESQQIARLERLPELVNADASLVHRGRFVTLDFLVLIGSRPCFISIEQGRVARLEFKPQRMRSTTFVIRAEAQAWEKFWQPMPEPWSQDLFAMSKKGRAFIEGNLHPFMANLQYFKDVMAAPRRA
jgi:hypothetical protein